MGIAVQEHLKFPGLGPLMQIIFAKDGIFPTVKRKGKHGVGLGRENRTGDEVEGKEMTGWIQLGGAVLTLLGIRHRYTLPVKVPFSRLFSEVC